MSNLNEFIIKENPILKQKFNPDYRADIDGLRAIAIISVIIFHFNETLLIGGFVGVDIFFVISGFLISSHIFNQLLITKTFSIKLFYIKRIKRIIPALFFMLLLVLFVGYHVFTNHYFKILGEQTFSAIFSYSNIYFFLTSGYFDLDSSLKPLLHTWSLGVEEQFYLIWPILVLLLIFFTKKIKHIFILLIFLTVCSLIFSETYKDNLNAIYYLLPFRIFEFTLGGLIATIYFNKKYTFMHNNTKLNDYLSILGIFLIAYSVLTTSKTEVFPYYNAFSVVIGASILILLNNTLVSKILSHKILVFIGMISYSLYLYHWPVIVFMKYEYIDILDIKTLFMTMIIILILSISSYKYIEQPFRFSKNRIFVLLLILLVILMAILSYSVKSSLINAHDTSNEIIVDSKTAFIKRFKLLNDKGCQITTSEKEKHCNWDSQNQLLFFGNSHNLDAYNMFKTQLDTSENNLIFGGNTYQCGYKYFEREDKIISTNNKCTNGAKKLLDKQFLQNIDVLVIHFFRLTNWGKSFMPIIESIKRKNPNIHIIIVGGYIGLRPNNCSELVNRYQDLDICKNKKVVTSFEDKELEDIKKYRFYKSNFLYIDTIKLLCGNEKKLSECKTFIGKNLMFYDGDHFSLEGSEYTGKLIFDTYDAELNKLNIIKK